jgi:hypothetical protein
MRLVSPGYHIDEGGIYQSITCSMIRIDESVRPFAMAWFTVAKKLIMLPTAIPNATPHHNKYCHINLAHKNPSLNHLYVIPVNSDNNTTMTIPAMAK